jgi:CrcB protein
MTPTVFALSTAAGGAGAGVRFAVDGWLRGRTRFPELATSIINLTGSFALGILVGLADVDVVSASSTIVLGAGFLGGYTTFSAASFETVTLIRSGRPARALLQAVGTLVACVALAGLGLWAGSHA